MRNHLTLNDIETVPIGEPWPHTPREIPREISEAIDFAVEKLKEQANDPK